VTAADKQIQALISIKLLEGPKMLTAWVRNVGVAIGIGDVETCAVVIYAYKLLPSLLE
jgi:hypothetical protein